MSGPPAPIRAVKSPGLPAIPLPRKTVEVGGVPVEFRSLSRTEALYVTSEFKGEAGSGKDADAAEIYVLSRGTGVTEEEAKRWRDETDPVEAGKVIDGILILSGIAELDEKGDAHPKA